MADGIDDWGGKIRQILRICKIMWNKVYSIRFSALQTAPEYIGFISGLKYLPTIREYYM